MFDFFGQNHTTGVDAKMNRWVVACLDETTGLLGPRYHQHGLDLLALLVALLVILASLADAEGALLATPKMADQESSENLVEDQSRLGTFILVPTSNHMQSPSSAQRWKRTVIARIKHLQVLVQCLPVPLCSLGLP